MVLLAHGVFGALRCAQRVFRPIQGHLLWQALCCDQFHVLDDAAHELYRLLHQPPSLHHVLELGLKQKNVIPAFLLHFYCIFIVMLKHITITSCIRITNWDSFVLHLEPRRHKQQQRLQKWQPRQRHLHPGHKVPSPNPTVLA
jgi:hypothetical protein